LSFYTGGVSRVDFYLEQLPCQPDWETYLLRESGLPVPRGNLELAEAVARLGDRALFECYMSHSADTAPANDPREFLAFCGTLGMGRLLAEGDESLLTVLRAKANDPRWRVREAVAMALQKLGDASMDRLLRAARDWSTGTLLERRAVAAGMCEPRLLRRPSHARRVIAVLNRLTSDLPPVSERRGDEFRTLRQCLGYAWSTAVAALPEAGTLALEKWLEDSDPDVRWIMCENLKKKRLAAMDSGW
jgi:hypothetical protein